ncbi:MAG TPA: GNAT family N-acetyltransferase [Bryobacteraceae bacterium]
MAHAPLTGPEKLAKAHIFDPFFCGVESLDHWLKRFARTNQQSDLTTTYVVHRAHCVVGYYSLTAGSVNREDAAARVAKRMPNHPIGVVLLARLAVDENEKGAGLGRALLKDALLRAASAADIIAVRAVLVHALNEDARRFYMRFDFEPSPVHPLHLMLLMKDIRASGGQH